MRRILSAAVLVLAALVPARAKSTDVDAITVGALVERADAAVVAVVEGPATRGAGDTEVWSFRVSESLRGPRLDDVLRVSVPAGRAPVATGGRFLAFLRKTEAGWESLELPWALRTTAEPGVAPLIEYARGYAACLGFDGDVGAGPSADSGRPRPAALAAHLVASLASSASGVPSCAGRDLVRHEELHAALTDEQRASVTTVLRAPRRADQDLAAIVLAAGACGGPGTDDALVALLLDPVARSQRRHIVTSLRTRASPALVGALARRIEGADAAQRADLANALGRLDLREAEPSLTALLRDESAPVRFEAAHSLGLLARAVRAPKAGDDAEAPRPRLSAAIDPLLAAYGRATTDAERRPVLWAVAQIDTQAAWEALRRVAKEAPAEATREIARGLLERPRTSLLPE